MRSPASSQTPDAPSGATVARCWQAGAWPRPSTWTATSPIERLDLGDGAWVDVGRGWLRQADEVYEHLLAEVPWQGEPAVPLRPRRRGAPGRRLVVARAARCRTRPWPRPPGCCSTATAWSSTASPCCSTATAPTAGVPPRHRHAVPRRHDHRRAQPRRRRGRGACAPLGRATRSRPGKGATHDLHPASGDLLVMGGRCQADWEHSVPVPRRARAPPVPASSIQWRFARKQGRPFQGARLPARRSTTAGTADSGDRVAEAGWHRMQSDADTVEELPRRAA